MAGVGIQTQVIVTDARFQRAIREGERRALDMRPAWDIVAEHMRRSTIKTFEAEGRPKKWKAWADSTKKARERKKSAQGAVFAGDKILQDSARLRASVHWRGERDSTVGSSDAVYAAIHQMGGMAGRGRKVKIDPRPFLVVQDEDIEYAAEAIAQYVAGAFGSPLRLGR